MCVSAILGNGFPEPYSAVLDTAQLNQSGDSCLVEDEGMGVAPSTRAGPHGYLAKFLSIPVTP